MSFSSIEEIPWYNPTTPQDIQCSYGVDISRPGPYEPASAVPIPPIHSNHFTTILRLGYTSALIETEKFNA
jgi:hypothetical protein